MCIFVDVHIFISWLQAGQDETGTRYLLPGTRYKYCEKLRVWCMEEYVHTMIMYVVSVYYSGGDVVQQR